MSVAAVGGAANVSAVAVTTLTVTYAPTAANVVVVFVNTSAVVTGLVVKDSAGNTLQQPSVPTVAGTGVNLAAFFQLNVPAGITGYTATWTGAAQVSIGVEEYSNAGNTAEVGANSTAAQGAGTTGSVTQTLAKANNFLVAGAAAAVTMTASAGSTQRQQTTTSTARLTILDNTSAVLGPVTDTVTLSNSPIALICMEIGGLGNARANQDVPMVIKQVTSSNARVNQNVVLVVKQPTPIPNARANQNVILVIMQKPKQPVIFVTG